MYTQHWCTITGISSVLIKVFHQKKDVSTIMASPKYLWTKCLTHACLYPWLPGTVEATRCRTLYSIIIIVTVISISSAQIIWLPGLISWTIYILYIHTGKRKSSWNCVAYHARVPDSPTCSYPYSKISICIHAVKLLDGCQLCHDQHNYSPNFED